MKMTVKMKALLFTSAVIVSISLIYTYESIRTEKGIIRSEIVKRAEAITSMATKNGELPLLSGSPRLLKDITSFLKAMEDVASVTFYDRGMKELIHEGVAISGTVPQLTPNVPVVISEREDSFIFYAPIFAERLGEDTDILHETDSDRTFREHIGWVRLVFSKASMWAAEHKIVERGILLLLLFAGGSSAIVYILITLALRPLTRIVQIANGIADGEFSRDLEKHRHDEIGTLANAFQQMKMIIQQVLHETDALVLAVKKGRLDCRSNAEPFRGEWRNLMNGVNLLTEAFANGAAELQEAKDSLEKRVEERTAELARANSALLAEVNERKLAEEALHHQAVELAQEVAERQMAQENLQEKALLLEEEIEKRQNAQDELEQLNERLEQRVQERTVELKEKYTELERMNKIFVGRELRMVELKERIRELEGQPNGTQGETQI